MDWMLSIFWDGQNAASMSIFYRKILSAFFIIFLVMFIKAKGKGMTLQKKVIKK